MTPLMLFTIAWIGGLLLGQGIETPAVWYLLAFPPASVLLVGWGDRRWGRRSAAMLVGLALGALRMSVAQPDITADHIAFYRDRGQVTIEGVVIADPDRRALDTRLRVRVDELTVGEAAPQSVEGKLLVYVPPYPRIHYGDRLRAVGLLETPPVFEDFSFADYLAREGIYALLREVDAHVLASHQANPLMDGVLRFKSTAHQRLQLMLPEPQGALLAGVLLGIEQGIPEPLVEAFERTGASHIVAISGFNLTMVAALVTRMARGLLDRRGGLLAALSAIWIYVILVGADASVMRAGVMSSLIALGQQEQRRPHGPTSLAAATFVLSVLNPFVLWDVGFQLSAAAVVGMLILAPPLTAWCTAFVSRWVRQELAERLIGILNDILIVTSVVQLTTLGIIAANFHAIPLVAPLTNFLILPAQPFIMAFGGLALVSGLLLQPLGQVLAWIAWVFLAYTIDVVTWTATFSWASLPVPVIAPFLVRVYHVGLAMLSLRLVVGKDAALRGYLKGGWDRARSLVVALHPYSTAAAGATVVLMIAFLVLRPDGRLHVTFLETGRGDAVLIRTPDGSTALIDGGYDPRQTLAEMGRQMPFWTRRLDQVILTSPDDDRLHGLIAVVERFEVAWVGTGPGLRESAIYAQWQAILQERPPGTVALLRQGDRRELSESVQLDVLWPPPDREGPLVLQLTHGEVKVLLMGGATTVVEKALVERYGPALQSQVLALPRQGDKTCCSVDLLQAVAPVVAAVQGDRLDDVTRAKLMDSRLYATASHGTVEIVSDGRGVDVRTRR